jgi:hypothetical protein
MPISIDRDFVQPLTTILGSAVRALQAPSFGACRCVCFGTVRPMSLLSVYERDLFRRILFLRSLGAQMSNDQAQLFKPSAASRMRQDGSYRQSLRSIFHQRTRTNIEHVEFRSIL